MRRQSKWTSAPAPMETPALGPQAVPPSGAQPVPQATMPPMFGPGAWCPPCPVQSMAPSSSAPYWLAGLLHPGMAGSSAQDPRRPPVVLGASENIEDSDLQAWGSDSHPPGGFVNFLKKNTTNAAQVVSNGNSSQPINVGDDTNDGDSARTEKRLLWTKEEDLRLDFAMVW